MLSTPVKFYKSSAFDTTMYLGTFQNFERNG